MRCWADDAVEVLREFVAQLPPGERFIAPDVRKYADERGFPQPECKRAWGGAFKRVRKLGEIEHVAYRNCDDEYPEMNAQPVRVWKKK